MSFNIFHIIQPSRQRIIHIHNKDFPIGFSFVEESHNTEYFDLFDLSDCTDCFTDFTHVERIIVAVGAGFGVLGVWVFPCLGEGTVVPDVTVVGETVSDVSEFAFLDVCSDRVSGSSDAEKRDKNEARRDKCLGGRVVREGCMEVVRKCEVAFY